jgi:hypothetical protein
MKWWMLLFTIGFFSPGVVFSQSTTPTATGPLQNTQHEVFELLMQIPAAKDRYDLCISKDVRLQELDRCLWAEFSRGDEVIVPDPGAAYREEISQALRATRAAEAPPTDVRVATSAVENLVRTKDPAFEKLQGFLEKRLRTALYSDLKSDVSQEIGKNRGENEAYTVVDQEHFYTLFESQVSKNIITTLSSFCIQTKAIIEKDKNDVRSVVDVRYDSDPKTVEENIARLSSSAEDFKLAENHYKLCMVSIPTMCNPECEEEDPAKCMEPDAVNSRRRTADSNSKACMVLRSMRSSRQQLLEIALIQRRLKQLAGIDTKEVDRKIDEAFLREAVRKGLAVDGQEDASDGLDRILLSDVSQEVRHYRADNSFGGIDRITSMTSGELHSTHNKFNEANTELAERFKTECQDNPSDEGCAGFLVVDSEDQQMKLAELSLRTQSLQELFNQYGDDEEQVKRHLLEEGFSQVAIDSMIASAGTTENLINQINEHYDNQRRALMKEVASLIESRTIDMTNPTSEESKGKLEKIYNELSERGNRFTKLLHYNNIVSGFFSLDTREGEDARKNTEMIRREMANSFYSPDFQSRNPTSIPSGGAIMENTNFAQLEQNLTDNQLLVEGSGRSETIGLKLEDLNNNFLRYYAIPTNE